MPDWSESTRGYGLLCSCCCNPWASQKMKGGQKTGEDGKPYLAFNVEGNKQNQGCIMLSIPPFIIFAPIFGIVVMSSITNSRLVIRLVINEKGVTEVVGDLRVKSCCGEDEDKLTGIRGAEMDKTLWTTLPNQGGARGGLITCNLTIQMTYGSRTIDCDQDGGERACREINEFISRFAPHVMAAPTQQVMLLAPASAAALAPAPVPTTQYPSAPPAYAQPQYAQPNYGQPASYAQPPYAPQQRV